MPRSRGGAVREEKLTTVTLKKIIGKLYSTKLKPKSGSMQCVHVKYHLYMYVVTANDICDEYDPSMVSRAQNYMLFPPGSVNKQGRSQQHHDDTCVRSIVRHFADYKSILQLCNMIPFLICSVHCHLKSYYNFLDRIFLTVLLCRT